MATMKSKDWVEPAHPVIVQQFDDLVDLYRFIRKQFQERIDTVFDGASRQIGFVVATTLPVTIQVGAEGKIEKVAFSAKNLEGTLFQREFAPIFEKMAGGQAGKVKAGDYTLHLLWYEALKLKLKADWMEPAHFQRIRIRPEILEQLAIKVPPEVQEPAHWFDAGIALAKEEEILISAIDEVYPELKLAERIALGRQEGRLRIPGIREPAHFRELLEGIIESRVAGKLSPGIREPAHFRKLAEILEREDGLQVITELAAVLKKYGM
jgi:hypothetical protein